MVNCPFCDYSVFFVGFKEHKVIEGKFYGLYECKNCFLGFISPQPTNKELQDYYSEEYFYDWEKNKEKNDQVRTNSAKLMMKQFLHNTKKVFYHRLSLLDIGC